jgi:hypothetical protein
VIGREVVAERSPLLGAGIKVRPIRRESLPPGDAAAAAAAMAPAEPEMVELTPERRARLIAYVEKNGGMPADVKRRLLAQLNAERVPAQMVDRIESRIGG